MSQSKRQISVIAPQRGFTLIELMVVIVIAVVLMTVAAPSFQDSLQRNRRLTALEEALAMLATGRSEAVARSTPVALCPSTNGSACSGNASWEEGVLLFEDDGAGSGTSLDMLRTGNEEIIRIFGAAGSGITLRSKGSFTKPKGMLFSAFGAVLERGTLVICYKDGLTTASAVVVNRSGQPRIALDENDSGVVNDDTGADLGACT